MALSCVLFASSCSASTPLSQLVTAVDKRDDRGGGTRRRLDLKSCVQDGFQAVMMGQNLEYFEKALGEAKTMWRDVHQPEIAMRQKALPLKVHARMADCGCDAAGCPRGSAKAKALEAAQGEAKRIGEYAQSMYGRGVEAWSKNILDLKKAIKNDQSSCGEIVKEVNALAALAKSAVDACVAFIKLVICDAIQLAADIAGTLVDGAWCGAMAPQTCG